MSAKISGGGRIGLAYGKSDELQVPPWTAIPRFDKLEFRSRQRLHAKRENFLERHCYSVDFEDRNRFRIVYPDDEALDELAKCASYLIPTLVEIALDVPTQDRREADDIASFFDRHFVHKRRGKQITRQVGEGTYTGLPREEGRIFVWYPSKPLKMPKSLKRTKQDCFHLECRMMGVATLRRIGIYSAADLKEFDHQRFWDKNLNLYKVNVEKLRKLHRKMYPDQPVGGINNIYSTRRREDGNLPDWREKEILQHLVNKYGIADYLERIPIAYTNGFI